MPISHVKFYGAFWAWNEGWRTYHHEEETSASHHCLKYQIERYIANDGQCPITAVDSEAFEEKPADFDHVPWSYKTIDTGGSIGPCLDSLISTFPMDKQAQPAELSAGDFENLGSNLEY